MSQRTPEQAPLFSAPDMRPTFGGRQLTPGAPVPDTAEREDVFAAAREAERDRAAARTPAEEMRDAGAPALLDGPRTVYGLLDAEARAWWYHATLRAQGNEAEARRRERASIRDSVAMLRALRDQGGSITWLENAGQYATSEYRTGRDTTTHALIGGYRHGRNQVEAARRVGIPVYGRDPYETEAGAV